MFSCSPSREQKDTLSAGCMSRSVSRNNESKAGKYGFYHCGYLQNMSTNQFFKENEREKKTRRQRSGLRRSSSQTQSCVHFRLLVPYSGTICLKAYRRLNIFQSSQRSQRYRELIKYLNTAHSSFNKRQGCIQLWSTRTLV